MSERDAAISNGINRSIDNADPEWKFYYLTLCSTLLKHQQFVEGGYFRRYCSKRGLWEPDTHNRWVGMPAHMERTHMIERVMRVEPSTTHSHIGQLMFWRSLLFDEAILYEGLPRRLDKDQLQQEDRPDTSKHD